MILVGLGITLLVGLIGAGMIKAAISDFDH